MRHGSANESRIRPLEFFLLTKAVWVYDLVLLRVPRGSQRNLSFPQLCASL